MGRQGVNTEFWFTNLFENCHLENHEGYEMVTLRHFKEIGCED
jgi:hypothetical protein